ncbi:MAG: multiheme c-type cytochrome [Planctomycetota bacterium]|nr:multiheme c-type cytochrome [Planctomycetota bacterium]
MTQLSKHLTPVRMVAICTLLVGATTALHSAQAQLPLGTNTQDFHMPGTQANYGGLPFQASFNCGQCHGGYDETVEPHGLWASSMMAQAGRDPIFYAALALAEQDTTNSGDLCLRCHAPGGWLAGRAVPTDGSGLDNGFDDFDGVTCHFCHRMVDPIADVNNPVSDGGILAALAFPPGADFHGGSFVVDPNDLRRGPFDLGPNFFLHSWDQSEFHKDSALCGTCHDVSNPVFEKQPDGSFQVPVASVGQPHSTGARDEMFALERTFSEWEMSVYGVTSIDSGGRFGGDHPIVQSCQDCHMPTTDATACSPGLGGVQRPDMPKHYFAGSNSWVLRAIDSVWPDFETGLTPQRIADAEQRNRDMLAAAADLEAYVTGTDLNVRITNLGGHKLPTGYAEGRRMWIEVQFKDAGGTILQEHGHYDMALAELDGASTTVYEQVQGLDNYMANLTGIAAGPSFHFSLNNTILLDNRIPPRGFDSAAFASRSAAPVAYTYGEQQHWDKTTFPMPPGATQASVRLFHQTTSKEYIEFLRDENTTNTTGIDAYNLWTTFGKSAPVEMGSVQVDFANSPCPQPIEFGLGKLTSLGGYATVTATGTPSVTANDLMLHVSGGIPNELMVCFAGPATLSQPHFGGNLLITPYIRVAQVLLDSNGEHSFPINVDPTMVGTATAYQAIFRDNASTFGIGMSSALWVEFCE